MNQLNLSVEGNMLILDNRPMTTSGSVNYDTCTFNFNKEWRGFSRYAVFSIGECEGYTVSLNDTSTCKIPKECLMQTGILRIGVVGENDEGTVISTNIITHRVIQGANEDYLDLPDDSVDTDDGEDTSSSGSPSSSYNMMWQDDRLRLPEDFVLDDYLNIDNTDIHTYYDVVFSDLVKKYPDYVLCNTEIEDYSGNPIYSFSFVGEDYDRVILITANHFGLNTATLAALGGFFRNLCENYKTNPALNFLHSKVKFVVAPIMCPEAMMAESRVNSNGVAPFVNYDNGFEDSPVEDKGDSAFSEIETVAFLSMVETLISENLVWVFDFESDANISSGKKIYYKANETVDINFISRAVNKFNSAYGDGNSVTLTEFVESNAPIATNYASIAYNLDACTVIWPDDHSAGVIDRETIQYADFIGNLLFETAMNSGTLKENRFKPFTKHVMWRSRSDDDCFSVKSSAAPMWISAYENRVDGVCNVSMNGYVIVEAEEVSRVRIKPILYQKNSPTDDYETRFNSNIFDIEINVNAGINVIPFNSVLSCKHSNIINTPSYLCSVIAAACTKPVKITGFSYTLNIIPSDERNAVEVLVPTGLVSDYTDENTTPVFAVEYPKSFYDIV